MSDFEEQQLLQACRSGDAEALRRLVDAHYDALHRFLWRLTASPEAAADLTQEVFVRALARLRSFDGRARFSTWLQVIAVNLWKNTRRRPPPEPWALPEEGIAAEEPACEQEALARLERREVWQAVERLPAMQRLAILLFYYEGMSYREIAELCNCPVGTVGSWIHHGIRTLRRTLGEPEADCPSERLPGPCPPRRVRPLEDLSMNCWECEEQIATAARGERGWTPLADATAEHLTECDACRAFAEQMTEVAPRLARCKHPSPGRPAPAAVREAIAARLAAPRRTPAERAAARLMAALDLSRLLHPFDWVAPIALGAVALIAFLGLGLARWQPRSGVEGRRLSVVSARPPGSSVPELRAASPRTGQDRRGAIAAMSPATALPAIGSPGSSGDSRPRASKRTRPKALRPTLPPRGDDLTALNEDVVRSDARRMSSSGEAWDAVEARLRRAVPVRDDFVRVPFPRVAAVSDRQIAEAAESYEREAAVVDSRLTRSITVQQKAIALSDLCESLRSETGIPLAAGQSVADEKVSLFCRKMPLREVMRQLSRPFGYTWLRSGKAGEYKYELVQDLRSQLLEEELRNRDRNGALLSLDREMERYRPYLGLTPDEALARSKTAKPEEKRLLDKLASYSWGAIQMYFRLSPRDLATMRAGQQWVSFSATPRPGERTLPPDLQRGVLQNFREWMLVKEGEGYRMAFEVANPATPPIPVPAAPEARGSLGLTVEESELGRAVLRGYARWDTYNSQGQQTWGGGSTDTAAEGISPSVLKPDNAAVNVKLVRDPAPHARVTVRPRPTSQLPPDPNDASPAPPEPRVTTADVLEAIHQATGLPIVSDYYTRLYKPEVVSVQNQPLFDALNHLADATRVSWRWGGGWLQLRSTSYYDDRRKEVPNRLLTRWAGVRRQQGALTLDDLVEIAQLPDAQLDGREMAEGARACFGLTEWDLARNGNLRPHLRFLAGLTPAQRQEAMAPAGLAFTRMPLAQQQRFITLALGSDGEGLQALDELAGAALRVEYTQPGGFQWGQAGHPGQGNYTRWVIPLEPGPRGRRVLRPIVQEKTREAALQAVRRVEPRLREALLEAARRADPRVEPSPLVVEEEQIFPTRLDLCLVYVPGATNARGIQLQTSFASYGLRPQ